ncbi:MAG: hypothetical protein OEZ18_00885 [Candidatus Bathyarchaeota archaeon]|nr:hypothetical protein [Candidatus Bathyarchaeota archaeon]
MKKKFSALIIGLLLAASMKTLPGPVYASNLINIVPSTAYVGMFRTIFIYVSASDTATGIWETGVWKKIKCWMAKIAIRSRIAET